MENIQHYLPKNVKVEIINNIALFEVSVSDIKKIAIGLRAKNLQLNLITAADERETKGGFKIWYVFGIPKQNIFIVPFIRLQNTTKFPSLTPTMHSACNFEKKIHTFFGLTPIGHPDLRPIILHENWPANVFPLRKDFDWQAKVKATHESYQFQKVEGEGIYEIPVGPIHAGIIEPGHFRFSVAGEEIILLEAKLGFVHKGSEKLFEILTLSDKLHLSEKISGDSSFSHSLAFCQAVEQLGDVVPPKRALYLRVIYAELERLANHIGDIGAIMIDTGFNFGGSQGARLKEMIMQINERLSRSRFLRHINTIGGVTKDIFVKEVELLSFDLKKIQKDFSEIIAVAENSTSLLNRLKGTGILLPKIAEDYGALGVAAKAVAILNDARVNFPYAAYSELGFNTIETEMDGDVYARFRVRIKEVYASIELIQNALIKLPNGPIYTPINNILFRKNALSVGIVEGWRGQIIYFITTDAMGNISRVAPCDPSFLNWPLVGEVGPSNVVPDFPLINKSFNLSYSGNDL
ncbi:MAG: hypothetical protein A3D34_00810 [Candidatus Staskawiczbacteria bacterium RIFCSPHIGHO2_02_FULL_33_16]|uniref:NADH-quinone oxidoreductase subunit D domain-containing protein n=1 Tax=Candidatus Staskawiczbacteria bacterium RIFCSPHIGHO2_02_FULL_33_16 TaxID=1802204 RepID=A0A1G2HXN9_9BACT|nr:MAG: hypothetical protein A3D34_00810 [Candidatus Staskawiczbacteria bacterium RIFCSPHIGHO2_02_FULL_33_16]OGZ70190.1 MAG: hypothetical protein A2980_00300 [Candidatus Staskawiczbacteria bacterium RIFCSPLOWO2_01_FULL_33_13]